MAKMPQLVIAGTCFVLTGRMWKDRCDIHADIQRMGGKVSRVMRKGHALVMASSQLYRGADNKWHPQGAASTKATAAVQLGSLVYHEKMLQDALRSPDGRSWATRVSNVVDDQARTSRQEQKVAREREPEWNDEMHAQMMTNMAKASELLAGFQD